VDHCRSHGRGTVRGDLQETVGPLAGYIPDPVYGGEQQRFNTHLPRDLATSGYCHPIYCHPILVRANGHGEETIPAIKAGR